MFFRLLSINRPRASGNGDASSRRTGGAYLMTWLPRPASRIQLTSLPNYRADYLSRAARRGDLLCRLTAELVGVDGELLAHLPARQHLDRPIAAGQQPGLPQRVGRDDGPRLELLAERIQVDDVVLGPE